MGTTETQYQQYLSCYKLNFDETLKVGSCEHQEQIPTVMVTFVQATFVLVTFVHIRNISGTDYNETLKIGSLEHLEQIPTVTLTFVQATFVLVTFVHFRKISAVTDMFWTKGKVKERSRQGQGKVNASSRQG